MVPALVLILITVGFVVVVARMVNPGGKRTQSRSIPRRSASHRRRPRPKAKPEGRFTASWRLLLTIIALAVAAAVAALLTLRSIFGLLEGLVT